MSTRVWEAAVLRKGSAGETQPWAGGLPLVACSAHRMQLLALSATVLTLAAHQDPRELKRTK